MEPSAAATNLVDVTWLLGQLDQRTAALVRAQLPPSVVLDSQDTESDSELDGVPTPLSSSSSDSFYTSVLTQSPNSEHPPSPEILSAVTFNGANPQEDVAGTPNGTVDQDGGALITSRGVGEGPGHRCELIEAQRNNAET